MKRKDKQYSKRKNLSKNAFIAMILTKVLHAAKIYLVALAYS